jgi:uncharacterized protein YbaR (Trm112 family)
MYIDLVDSLRCPRPHPPTWLVAAALETRGRVLVRGTLGCPICEAQFPIVDGVAVFDDEPATQAAVPPTDDAEPGERALRLAALLDLAAPGGIVAVGGAWDDALDPLLDLTDVRALVLEPPAGWRPREPLGAVRGGGVPVAAGALRGVALDAATADAPRLDAAVRVLRPRGRLVAPADAPMPAGVTELARDGRLWVAERAGSVESEPVALRRR